LGIPGFTCSGWLQPSIAEMRRQLPTAWLEQDDSSNEPGSRPAAQQILPAAAHSPRQVKGHAKGHRMSKYTVILATHQRPKLLQRALRSVKTQSFGKVDVIVVSDVLCDQTQSAVSSYLEQQDVFIQLSGVPGPAESRNAGMRLVTSDYVVFLDDDDELSPDFLANAGKYLTGEKQVIYTDFIVSDDVMVGDDVLESATGKISLQDKAVNEVYVKNFIPNSGVVYPTACLKYRAFDTTLPLNEDWDFILNTLKSHSFSYAPVDGPIIHKRRGRNGENRGTRNLQLLPETYLKIYKKWPAPTMQLKQERLSLMAATGMAAELQDL
jgi:glycosyltransferase involved in cell wall biosynthesis